MCLSDEVEVNGEDDEMVPLSAPDPPATLLPARSTASPDLSPTKLQCQPRSPHYIATRCWLGYAVYNVLVKCHAV